MTRARISSRVIAGLVGLGLIAGAAPAHALRMIQNTTTGRVSAGTRVPCDDPGGFVHWDRRNIDVFLNTENQGSGKDGALREALRSWTDVASADHVLRYAGTTGRGFSTDGVNTFLWARGNGCTGSCLALTALVLQTGQVIVETDVTFNNDVTWTTNGNNFDAQTTVTHELGHVLGIHHTELTTTPTPTMEAIYFGVEGRSLENDDKAALQCSESHYPVRAATAANAASYSVASLAPDSIVATFGTRLASVTQAAASVPLPTELGGTIVRVFDAAGNQHRAGLFYVSPTQVNFAMPASTALGVATVIITSRDGDVSHATPLITRVAPGLFSAAADGQGVASAQVLRVRGGVATFEAVARFDEALGRWVPIPIDFGPSTDTLYLVLYGTGVRLRTSLTDVSVAVGNTRPGVLFAGPQDSFVGLDQINAGPLDRSLATAGTVNVTLNVEGSTSNTVTVTFLNPN